MIGTSALNFCPPGRFRKPGQLRPLRPFFFMRPFFFIECKNSPIAHIGGAGHADQHRDGSGHDPPRLDRGSDRQLRNYGLKARHRFVRDPQTLKIVVRDDVGHQCSRPRQ
jgi:hypothetical protein